MSVSKSMVSVAQECFSQLLLQDMVGHSQAQGLAEKKLEIKHFSIFLIFWEIKSKNNAKIVGRDNSSTLLSSSVLYVMMELHRQNCKEKSDTF